MPTGYTAAVVDGKITEFPEFALSCARASGALIMMRDDPMDAPIPDELKPEPYSKNQLEKAKARLAELNAMTAEQVQSACENAYATAQAGYDAYEARCEEEDRRLKVMLGKVDLWEPPTANHVEMKKFMIDQLTISMRGSYRSEPPVLLSPPEWHEAEIKQAMKDVAYHAGEHAKEIERAQGRTEWLKALRSSFTQADGGGK